MSKRSRRRGPHSPKNPESRNNPNAQGDGNAPPKLASRAPNSTANHAENGNQDRGPPNKSRFASIVGDANVWIALGTVALAVIGVFSAWAFMESERADVQAVRAYFVPPPKLNEMTVVIVELENGGKHTAVVTDSGAFFHWSGTDNQPLPEFPDYTKFSQFADDNVGNIPEGKTITARMLPRRGRAYLGFVGDELNRLTSGVSVYRVYGYVTYRDEFSWILGERTLGFCFKSDAVPTFGLIPCGMKEAKNYMYTR